MTSLYKKLIPSSNQNFLYRSKFSVMTNFVERKNLLEQKNTSVDDSIEVEKTINQKYDSMPKNQDMSKTGQTIGGYGKKFSFGRIAGRH